MKREAVATQRAPAVFGPYSLAIKTDGFVFTAGQLGLDPETGKLVEGVEAQTRQALRNLSAVLEAAGTNMENVVKATIFLTNMADFPVVNAAYGAVFSGPPPARSTVQAAALPLGGLVEIALIALLP